jgi:small conductance mechanosensitive channel
VVGRISTLAGGAASAVAATRLRVRRILAASAALLAFAIVGYNGWLVVTGVNVTAHTRSVVSALSRDHAVGVAMAIGRLAVVGFLLIFATRAARWALGHAEAAINRWDQLADNNRSLAVLFAGLKHAATNTAWLFFLTFAVQAFSAPARVVAFMSAIVRAYLILAVGLLIVRSTVVTVDTLDAVARRYAERRSWLRYYDHLRPLVPNFRLALEYSLWIAMASLVLLQIGPLAPLASWGPLLIQAIGIAFAGAVVVEVGRLEILHRLLPREGLDEMSRRRRSTMAPLVRSMFTYAVTFGTVVPSWQRWASIPCRFSPAPASSASSSASARSRSSTTSCLASSSCSRTRTSSAMSSRPPAPRASSRPSNSGRRRYVTRKAAFTS